MGTKLREVMGMTAGPETAKQARETYKQNLLQPYRETETRPRSVEALPYKTPPALEGKIVFKDPLEPLEAARRFEAESLDKRLDKQAWIEEQRERMRSTIEANQEKARWERLVQQQKLQFSKELGDQIKFYRGQGVKNPGQGRRLALNDYSDLATQLGIEVPPLTQDDNNVLGKVQAQINRLNQLAIRGGAGGGGDNIQTWIELSDGSIVQADKVNFDRLPIGVTVKKMFTTINGQPFGGDPVGGTTIEQKIEALRAKGASDKEIIDAIRQVAPQRADELIKKFGLKAASPPPSAPELRNVFADPEGTSFGLGGIGGEAGVSQEEIRKRIELSVMKSEVDWLKSQLDYAEKQMAIAPGVVPKGISPATGE